MRQTYTVEGIGKVILTDNTYLASGGEAAIHVKDDIAYKIYLDPKKMIPSNKIVELGKINSPNVLIPKNIIYDSVGSPVGYSMDYKDNTSPICKLFTKAFKQRNNISNETIISLVEEMQGVIENNIHPSKCLVVDLNELNLLVSNKFDIVYFIDVDSYQTPSYRATALMESIRDRKIKNNKWTEESDWYSFAIIAFQMLIGIHPYKGSHPDYKPNEWLKRMEDGVSVFDPKAKLPTVCNDFSIIPPSHLRWFKDIFLNNNRSIPPKMGDVSIVINVPQFFNVTNSNDSFEINKVEECYEPIVGIFNFMGINYMVGSKSIYRGKNKLPIEIYDYNKVLLCETNSTNPVVCKLKDDVMYIDDDSGKYIGNVAAKDMMHRNSCIYTIHGGKLLENSFTKFGEKTIHSARLASNVYELATQVFDGVIIQDLMGKCNITLPYEKGKCVTNYIKELDGFRILDAKSEKNICGIMAERNGLYYSFVLSFNAKYDSYVIRFKKDVSYTDINLTVLPNGVAVMANNEMVEIFKDQNVKTIENPPFDSTTKLYNYSGGIFYVDGKNIMSARMKNK